MNDVALVCKRGRTNLSPVIALSASYGQRPEITACQRVRDHPVRHRMSTATVVFAVVCPGCPSCAQARPKDERGTRSAHGAHHSSAGGFLDSAAALIHRFPEPRNPHQRRASRGHDSKSIARPWQRRGKSPRRVSPLIVSVLMPGSTKTNWWESLHNRNKVRVPWTPHLIVSKQE